MLAERYRRRWEIEKVFDEIKNQLGQKQAWGSSLVAKETQARFLILTHNLLLRDEQALAERHGVENQAEDQRRAKRTTQAAALAARKRTPLSSLRLAARGQRAVKTSQGWADENQPL